MKIAVCIKHVPDTTLTPKPKSDQSGIDLATANKYIISPYDEYGLTEAVALQQKFGGDVDIYSVGSDKAQESLRKGLAMGATAATLIRIGETDEPSGLTTAKLLANQLKPHAYDLIFFGMKAVDDELAVVGPAVAALLGIPVVCAIHSLELAADGKSGTAKRHHSDGIETLSFQTPAVLTTDKGLNSPKPPSLPAIMKAKKIDITIVEASLPAQGIKIKRVAEPAARGSVKMLTGNPVQELVGALKSDVKII